MGEGGGCQEASHRTRKFYPNNSSCPVWELVASLFCLKIKTQVMNLQNKKHLVAVQCIVMLVCLFSLFLPFVLNKT